MTPNEQPQGGRVSGVSPERESVWCRTCQEWYPHDSAHGIEPLTPDYVRESEIRKAFAALASPSESPEESGALNQLADEILVVNRANGWHVPTPEDWEDPNRIPTFLALIHSEVSEALEGFRIDDRENVAEELADVLIRTLDLARGLGVDMDAEVAAKLEKNRHRGIRHGGSKQI